MFHTLSPAWRLRGVPSIFVGACEFASRGWSKGYNMAGWHLAHVISLLMPLELDADIWYRQLTELERLLKARDEVEVMSWFDDLAPNCMRLVPYRSRPEFYAGVMEYFDACGMNWG